MQVTPAIDPTLLDAQSFGDPALAAEILGMFAEQAPELMRALLANSCGARADVAHRLKGSALAIGASGLASAASDLETQPSNLALLQKVESALSAVLTDIEGRTASC